MIGATVVKGAYIVTLFGNDKDEARILWATVIDDQSRRFEPGDYVCTTPIRDMRDGYVFTRNSAYKVNGETREIELPLHYLMMLRAGFSPAMYEVRKNKKT